MCKFYKFLYRLIPFKSFQSFLIKEHFSRCLLCQEETEIDIQLKEILVIPDKVKAEESLWSEIKPRLYSPGEEDSESKTKIRFFSFRKWKWALTASFLLLVVIVALTGINYFLLDKPRIEKGLKGQEKRVIVKSATIQGKPAKLYFFQPKNRKMSIIWIRPTIK